LLCNQQIGANHLTIKIPHSKTDQLKNGGEVFIVRTRTNTCPVAMLECHICKSGIVQLDSEDMLFRATVRGKIEKLRDSGGFSYSKMRELL